MQQFLLPDPGEGLVEADIVSWRVAVGDVVKVNDIVVEVETSKSLVELPVPYAGRVAELLVSEGDLVEVGAPIIVIDDGQEPPAGDAAAGAAGSGTEPRVPNLVGYGPRAGSSRRRARKTEPVSDEPVPTAQVNQVFDQTLPVSRRFDDQTPIPPVTDQPVGKPLPSAAGGQDVPVVRSQPRALAKPPVRKLAKDRRVDLSTLAGSGDGGVITRDDVLAAAQDSAEGSAGFAAERTAPDAGDRPSGSAGSAGSGGLVAERIPVRGVRKATAQAMVASAFTAPHVTEWLEVDVTATMELVASLKQHPDFAGVRVSPTLWVARATLLALIRHPALNASWDEAAGEIVRHGQVNLGLAAATPRGLLVPNVKHAETLSLRELATALNELVETAKQGRTQPAATSGGTFTITNVGVFGVDGGTPILNPGEAGILCVGAASRRPWVVGSGAEERLEPRWVMTLAVSFDHRMVDGEQGSLFLAEVARLLRQPALALI